MGKYFGTDGFRGEANEVLTVEHAFKVGRFLDGTMARITRPELSLEKTQGAAATCLSMRRQQD